MQSCPFIVRNWQVSFDYPNSSLLYILYTEQVLIVSCTSLQMFYVILSKIVCIVAVSSAHFRFASAKVRTSRVTAKPWGEKFSGRFCANLPTRGLSTLWFSRFADWNIFDSLCLPVQAVRVPSANVRISRHTAKGIDKYFPVLCWRTWIGGDKATLWGHLNLPGKVCKHNWQSIFTSIAIYVKILFRGCFVKNGFGQTFFCFSLIAMKEQSFWLTKGFVSPQSAQWSFDRRNSDKSFRQTVRRIANG